MKKAINILLLLIAVTSFTANTNAMGRLFRDFFKKENSMTCKLGNKGIIFKGLTHKKKIKTPDVDINIDIFNTCNSRYRIVYEEHDSFSNGCETNMNYQKSTKKNSKLEKENDEKTEESVLLFDGCYDTPTTTTGSL